MSVLDKKLVRNFKSIWSQALAIALVISAGTASLILAAGSYRSLHETRELYYERYRFAHVFANARRAPESLARQVRQLDGVTSVETRITGRALLDIAGQVRPVNGLLLSLPGSNAPEINSVHLRVGRLPDPKRRDEVIVNESFAKAQKFKIGDDFSAIINGKKQTLIVVGTALSPEFVYARQGNSMPDPRQYGVIWMNSDFLAQSFDMKSAFNSISLKLRRDASVEGVIDALDGLLAPYGGSGIISRKHQSSHAFIEAMLNVLRTMTFISPPIFLAVAAYLINITLARLITIERVQIGLLKALGFRPFTIVMHYIKLISIITTFGVLLGFGTGIYLGHWMTAFYSNFYHFPFFIFLTPPDLFIIAALSSFGAAVLGTVYAIRSIIDLPPAVAMAPSAPTQYGNSGGPSAFSSHFSQTNMMIFRHLIRFPVRSALTLIGVALSIMLLIGSLVFSGAIDRMVDVTYFKMLRASVNLQFTKPQPLKVLYEVERLPGVLSAEARRVVPATLRHENISRRINVTGLPKNSKLIQLIDTNGRYVAVPDHGVALTDKLAEILGVSQGDIIDVQSMTGKRRVLNVPVSAVLQGYMGLFAFMELDNLNQALGDGASINGVDIDIDENQKLALFEKVKTLPSVANIASLQDTIIRFRQTLARNILVMAGIFVALSVTIDVGVIYNSARIHLSERGRELASLRVLGFTQSEVAKILLGEFAIIVAFAIPLGCVLGTYYTSYLLGSMGNEIYRIPVFVDARIYVYASLIAVFAAILSSFFVRKLLVRMDIVEALKSRE